MGKHYEHLHQSRPIDIATGRYARLIKYLWNNPDKAVALDDCSQGLNQIV